MQTVLLVTEEPAHRFLYEHGLRGSFRLLACAPGEAPREPVAAVIYDLSTDAAIAHFPAIEKLGVPTVVLTPDRSLPMPAGERQVVLEYPVSPPRVLQALALLGVRPHVSDVEGREGRG